MMNIELYSNRSEPIVMDKDIELISELFGTLRTGTSILNPSITVDIAFDSVVKANYAYIPEFDRYYFITNTSVVNNKLVNIDMHVDVLSTYKDDVRLLNAIVKRAQSASDYNLYLNDGSYTVYQYENIVTKKFPAGLSDAGSFVLALAGSN